LDVVELVLAVEEELGVKISDEEAENIKTVEDLVRLVQRQKSE
jgi:acyl carrier protein